MLFLSNAVRRAENGSTHRPVITTEISTLEILRRGTCVVKGCEILVGILGISLLLAYGFSPTNLGSLYYTLLATMTVFLLISVVIIFHYLKSIKSFYLIRQSLFEIAFTITACVSHGVVSSIFCLAVILELVRTYDDRSSRGTCDKLLSVSKIIKKEQ